MKKGFTLIELLATIAIMAVLIAAVLPFVSNYRAWASQTVANRSARLVYDAINRYNALTPGSAIDGTTPITAVESALVGAGSLAFQVSSDSFVLPGDRFLGKLDTNFAVSGSASSLSVTYTGPGTYTGSAP